MEPEKFKSSLGEVAVTEGHVERMRNDSDDWDNITSNFSEQKLVDYANFDKIEELKFDEGSIYPNIRLKLDGEWKRLFFHVGDEARKCFKTLRYRWKAYRQVY